MIALATILSAGTYGIRAANAQDTDAGSTSTDKGSVERKGDKTEAADRVSDGKGTETERKLRTESGNDTKSDKGDHDRKSDRNTENDAKGEGHDGHDGNDGNKA